MRICYSITVSSEYIEMKRLMTMIIGYKQEDDPIVILVDSPKTSPELDDVLDNYNKLGYVTVVRDTFDGHFANWKNKLLELARQTNADYTFNIDADEIPSEQLLKDLPTILDMNSDIELMGVPRENTIDDLTDEYRQRWGWRVDPAGRINWPDVQYRIIKLDSSIQWANRVHEVPKKARTVTDLPTNTNTLWLLKHPKTLSKQIKQNAFYENLQR